MLSLKLSVINLKLCSQEKNRQRALFQMKKELHLVTFITQEELELYRERKNVDLVIKLLKQYHDYLNMFFKKEVDILPEHRVYNHVINLKEEFLSSSFTLYDISRNEI